MSYSQDDDQQTIHDLAARQIHLRGPRKAADVIAELLARRGYAQGLQADELAGAWEKAAGPLAKHSRPGNVKRGALEVYVSNSAAMQELTFQKRALLKRLKEAAPGHKITSLRFRIGAIE